MCLYPKKVNNPKYRNAAAPDPRLNKVEAKCGKCSECRMQNSKEWSARIIEEIRGRQKRQNGHFGGYFVTMTYSPEALIHLTKGFRGVEGYELDNAIARRSITEFRDKCKSKNREYPKMYLTTELSGKNTERLHIHGFIWNLGADQIREFWKFGHVDIQRANFKHAHYVTKYIHKPNQEYKTYQPIRYVSNGIGKNYIEKAKRMGFHTYRKGVTKQHYTAHSGEKMPMSRYWREKIWGPEIRDKINLDNVERPWIYVRKQKIDKNHYSIAENLREDLRAKDIRLGYPTPSLEGKIFEQYERQRAREQLRRMRIQKLYYEDN